MPTHSDKLLANYGGLFQFSEDDALVAAGVGAGVLILDRQGEVVLRLEGEAERDYVPHVWCVAISRQAGQVAAGFRDGTVCVWSLEGGRLVAQRRVTAGIIGGIAFVGLDERPAGRQLWRRQAPRVGGLLAVTAGYQVALLRARDLRVLGVLPHETYPSFNPNFTTAAADRSGEYVAAGRDNGHVLVWRRAGDGYQELATLQCDRWVTRVLLHIEPAGADQGVYVYAASGTDKPLPHGEEGEASQISSWKFLPDNTYARVATSLCREVTDIALGSDRATVLYTCRTRRALSRYVKPLKYGLVANHTHLNTGGSDLFYYEEFIDGVLSVAVTADLMTAFVRDDMGRVTRVEPRNIRAAR